MKTNLVLLLVLVRVLLAWVIGLIGALLERCAPLREWLIISAILACSHAYIAYLVVSHFAH